MGRVYQMQVNHMNNPIGFYMNRTVFSWKVADVKGKHQKAAKIVVWKEDIEQDPILDTGWDSSLNSLGSQLELSLEPCTRYFWTVSIMTDAEETVTGDVCYFETAKMQEAWTGKWITCCNEEKRHPVFKKQITVKKALKRARIYVSGLGLYEMYYLPKGQDSAQKLPKDIYKIGEEYLTPYSNDYNGWVQYQTYDVTNTCKENGTLAILLGNGWYKARFGFDAKEDKGFYGNEWKLIAELHLEYEDGEKEIIGTDESWNVERSNITFSNLYDGEQVDDTLAPLPIEKAVLCDAPKGVLTERLSLPVTVHETFEPKELIYTPAEEWVYDLGQEFAGIFALTVDVPKGCVVHIQTGEILQNGNFYNENLRTAKSEYIYISDGEKKTIRPHFTYYGYRYVKVSGIEQPRRKDFIGLALYSEIGERGTIQTGDQLVNQFISNVRWGLKSNFIDVPTDCPQRDERMGWTGDAQVFSSTAMYLEDTYAFYRKFLYDMYEEQKEKDGMVPHVIPSSGIGMNGAACVWGDAACIIPWNMYLTYGDKSILEDQFDSMKAWVDYITRVDGDNHGWRYIFHFGDWLALDNPNGDIEQVLGATDEEYIANIYYAASAEILSKAAKVLGKSAEEAHYGELAKKQFDIVKQEYFSASGRCCVKTQTGLILALKYGLTSNVELTRQQLRKLFEHNHDKLKTGFVGTPLLCNVLSDHGYSDLAFKLLLNREYPGWLHEIELGATTVWERWNSILDDGTISGIGMNSMNHYAYGSVTDWIFRHVAGLAVNESVPGFMHLEIKPELNWDLRMIEAEYDSPAGLYKSSWNLTSPSEVTCKFTIPFGCTAHIYLPHFDPAKIDPANPLFANVENGYCAVDPGTYEVTYTFE